ncbi:major facilitator superfamily transporter [Nocardia nova SH22a]|uniref:Major facilitator superfamily transporter n=1 Tax=Nocardia nova SH22a TaxID=1415166 RepID=W5T732_9NOCA|nr:MFS transporter [Nocardia nova]AHH14939.1 major facilitator superfamily transporter [Nocardia nova SH22a]
MIEVLRHPQFRRLFTAQVVALAGTGLLTVALGLLAYDLAGRGAGAVLGTALAIKMVAYVVVAPVVSAAAERVPRRGLLVSADVIRLGIALMLPFVGQIWQIYVLIFVLQSASATFTPAFQAVIPAVLPDERDYTRALSLSRLAYDLESLLSPVLASVLLVVASYHRLFLGTALGFAVSAIMVIGTPLPRLMPADRSIPLVRRMTRGAAIMSARPELRGLLAMNLAVAAATALVIVNTVVYVRDLLHGPAWAVGFALAVFGGGSMVTALCVPGLVGRVPDRQLMLTGCAILPVGLCAAMMLPVAPIGWRWVLLVAIWAALGAGTSLINTPSARLLRAGSDSDTRTAVFTAQFSLSHACFLVTYPIAGWIGAALGQFTASAVLAMLATLATVTAARVWPVGIASDAERVSTGA